MQNRATINPIACRLEDYRWLTGQAAIESLQWAGTIGQELTSRIARLRTCLSAERAHLVLEQAELRAKARTKFAAADRMFFTARGLEQATDEIVAAYKANRFAGRGRAYDLCCGIGGDSLALAGRGETVGVEREAIVAILAQANGHALLDGSDGVRQVTLTFEVQVRDVALVDVAECEAWHIDPDRRPAGRRTTLADLHEPGPETIDRLLSRNRNAAIKLAPAARMPPRWTGEAELEWISRGHQCRQLVAWFGDLAERSAMRRATVLSAAAPPRSIVGRPGQEPPIAHKIGRYLFEPDAAVLAAKLDGALAGEHALAAIARGIAYWTLDKPIFDPALACFEVQEVLPFRAKQVKALLRARDIGQLEIKKRGVDHDPATVRRQLDLRGSQSATLILAPVENRVTAILARRV
jgi:hypothetical protein